MALFVLFAFSGTAGKAVRRAGTSSFHQFCESLTALTQAASRVMEGM